MEERGKRVLGTPDAYLSEYLIAGEGWETAIADKRQLGGGCDASPRRIIDYSSRPARRIIHEIFQSPEHRLSPFNGVDMKSGSRNLRGGRYTFRVSPRGLIHSSDETMRRIGYMVTRPFINDPAERYCIANGSFGPRFSQDRLERARSADATGSGELLGTPSIVAFPITILCGSAELEEAGTEFPSLLCLPSNGCERSERAGPGESRRGRHSRLVPARNKGCKRRRVRAEDKEERMAPTRYANTRAADTGWVVPLHLLTPRPPLRYVVAAVWTSIRMRLISSIRGPPSPRAQ